jgi:hypothetical protein
MLSRRVKLLILLLAAALLSLAAWRAKRWLDIDRCLDAGGRWDYSAQKCDFGER